MNMKNIYVFVLLLFMISCSSNDSYHVEGLVPINGTELFINAFGEGDPILFVHGGPGLSHDYFLPQLATLSEEFNVIFYDQRVSGKSSANVSADSVSFSIFVEDIEALREETGYEKINILAHSWGSLIAVEYTIRYPEKVNKLILSNPIPLSTEYNSRLQEIQQEKMTEDFITNRKELIESKEFKNGTLAAYEDLFKLGFSLSFYDTTNLKNLNFKLYEGFFERNTALQNFTGLEEYNFYPLISGSETEILLIRGKSDLTLKEADERLVNTEHLILMEKSGHFPFVEERKKYLKVVSNFLKQ